MNLKRNYTACASGGSAECQTIETLDKQGLKNDHWQHLNQRRMSFGPRNEGQNASVTRFQGGTPCRRRQFFLRLNRYTESTEKKMDQLSLVNYGRTHCIKYKDVCLDVELAHRARREKEFLEEGC